MLLLCLLLSSSTQQPRASPPAVGFAGPSVSTDDVLYRHPGAAAGTSRSLTKVLNERGPSVRSFGARGDCLPARIEHPGRPGGEVTAASCPHDDTAAFEAALKWMAGAAQQNLDGRVDSGVLFVPAGDYRIDGTVTLTGTSMQLSSGANLKRTTLTANTDPVVRLDGNGGRLI